MIEEVRLGGILHDIGKIGVPEAVLNKPGRLTPEEYEVMKSHAVWGAKILEPLKVKAIERIRGMVRHHHEMVDGTGYPDGLKGDEYPAGRSHHHRGRLLRYHDFRSGLQARAYPAMRPWKSCTAAVERSLTPISWMPLSAPSMPRANPSAIRRRVSR